MKTLQGLEIGQIQFNDSITYLMVITPYEPYGASAEPIVLHGTGNEMIEKIKDVYDYDFEEGDSIEEFLQVVDNSNGDGNDYIQVYLF